MAILMFSLGAITPEKNREVVRRHLEYAKASGWQVHMIAYSPGMDEHDAYQVDNQFFYYPSGASNPLTFPFMALRKAVALSKRYAFRVMYAQDPFGTAMAGLLARRWLSIPLIIGNHASFINNSNWIRERPVLFSIYNFIGKLQLKKADALKTVSRFEKEKYVKQLGIKPEHVYVQNTPVDPVFFSKKVSPDQIASTRAALGIPPNMPVIIWVGRPVLQKRLSVLIATFAQIRSRFPDVVLLLIGNRKQLQENLSDLIEKSGHAGHIFWLENGVPNDDLPAYYQLSTLFLNTSSYEGLCKTSIEAAAAGLPLVMTRVSGAEEVVEQGVNGFLTPIDDVGALAEKVVYLLENPQTAKAMGEASKAMVLRDFDYQTSVKNLTNKWLEVAEKGLIAT